MKVGFIGLGRMGSAMAGRLIAAGHDLAVYNRTSEKTRQAAEAGAKVVGSIAEAAAYGDAVFTMLANDAAVIEVAEQAGGLLETLPKSRIHVCAGTHSVATIQKLATAHNEAGQVLLASPLFGRPDMVTNGLANITISGPAAGLKQCRPLFDAIAKTVYEAGDDAVAAAVIKIANNFALGCAIEAMGEGVSLVRKYDIDPKVLYDVMTGGMFSSPAYTVYGKMIVEEAYLPAGQRAVLGLKDANLALAAAEAVGVPLPSGNVWRDRLIGALAHGEGEHDWGVMAREQARASGLT
jgi:3-hydroxyisobutyrate dehydrogenase-like beta-hydroxyacid dehydrogenase